MSNVYTSIDQLIGRTPLPELTHFEADEDLKARVLVKLEYFNPCRSVKEPRRQEHDRRGREKAGKLVRGGDYTIIEPTSGATLGRHRLGGGSRLQGDHHHARDHVRRAPQAYAGIRCTTRAHRRLQGHEGRYRQGGGLQKETQQHHRRPVCKPPTAIHKATTGPEIWDDTDGKGRHLRRRRRHRRHRDRRGRDSSRSKTPPRFRSSPSARHLPLCSQGRAGPHKIQASVPALCPTSSTPRSMTRSSPSRTTTPLPPAAVGHKEGVLVGHFVRRRRVGRSAAGQAPRERGQDHRGAARRYR